MIVYLGIALLVGSILALALKMMLNRNKLQNTVPAETPSPEDCLNCKTCLCWSCMPSNQPGAEIYSVNKKSA